MARISCPVSVSTAIDGDCVREDLLHRVEQCVRHLRGRGRDGQRAGEAAPGLGVAATLLDLAARAAREQREDQQGDERPRRRSRAGRGRASAERHRTWSSRCGRSRSSRRATATSRRRSHGARRPRGRRRPSGRRRASRSSSGGRSRSETRRSPSVMSCPARSTIVRPVKPSSSFFAACFARRLLVRVERGSPR